MDFVTNSRCYSAVLVNSHAVLVLILTLFSLRILVAMEIVILQVILVQELAVCLPKKFEFQQPSGHRQKHCCQGAVYGVGRPAGRSAGTMNARRVE